MSLETLIEELEAASRDLLPRIEGLQDFSRLNLGENTHSAVTGATEAFQRRLALLDAAIRALWALLNDGYPDLPARVVTETIVEDLREQLMSLQLAYEKFEPEAEATTASITASEPEKK